jgi:hypothetical protein
MPCTGFAQAIDHVTEKLIVTALIGADCDAVGIFLDRRPHNIVDTAVVAEMDNLSAACLYQASHDIDGGIMAIKQRRCGNEAQRRYSSLVCYAWQIAGCSAHCRNSLEISHFVGCNNFNLN